jgi:hypothetical protein
MPVFNQGREAAALRAGRAGLGASGLMGEAIAERLPEITMDLVSDLLAEPRGT